jgi:hypothetical protein
MKTHRHWIRLVVPLLLVGLLTACATPQAPATQPGGNALLAVTVTPDTPPTPVHTPTPLGTEDPNEGLLFDELTLTRTGGIAGTTYTITVLRNGALLVDGQLLGSVPEETVIDLDRQLDEMGFFRLQSRYGPIQAGADTFEYQMFVSRDSSMMTVQTVDNHIPQSLQRLFDDLLALEPVGPPPEATPLPQGDIALTNTPE